MALSLVGYGAPDGNGDVAEEPIAEPVTLAEAKRQVRRVDVDDDDTYLGTMLIPAVRERGEQATRRQFITATWDLRIDHRFPCEIVIPRPPLQSVTSITYVDTAGVTQTLAADQYQVDAPSGPQAQRGRIRPVYGVIWPITRCQMNAVTVRFVAGYGDDDSATPPRLKLAMLLDLGTLYENREDAVVGQGFAITPFPNDAASVYRTFKSY